MTISFDLDDLLINGSKRFPTEKAGLLQKIMSRERIRKGTVTLFRDLMADGHQLCIYTTSLRSEPSICLMFWSYGIRLTGVYNKKSHDRHIKHTGISSSKYPPMFGIDLHIDDAEGVGMEARRFGFRAVIITEHDISWTETVLREVEACKNGPQGNQGLPFLCIF